MKSLAPIGLTLMLVASVAMAQAPVPSADGGVQIISLAGKWGFQLDPTDFERAFENSGAHRDPLTDTITLPGTTDTNRKGTKTASRPINRLSRLYEYAGPAWYRKEVTIPASWEGKAVELHLERVLWISSVYVDGTLAGSYRSFSAPHAYDLTGVLNPGKHVITVCVDNRVPPAFDRWSHAFSEYTQTAWNGIVGAIELRARDAVSIADVQVYPEVAGRAARVVCAISNPNGRPVQGTVTLAAQTLDPARRHAVEPVSFPFSGAGKAMRATGTLRMGDAVQLWDEFTPVLYRLTAALSARSEGATFTDEKSLHFGMREFRQTGAHFAVNGRPAFLRGTLECAVFPLTGYPDMSVEGWLRICETVKSYGLNHIRFHSWCPPEAAFAAADRTGVYLQAELPCWTEVGKDEMLNAFFREEMDRILQRYGNHPSFVQLCMGNELRGDFSYLAGLVKHGRETDSRRLYSGATARTHLPEDEFYVSHQTSAGGITTYGARGPQTDYDLRKAYDVLKVPGVAHEVGQRAVYPDFAEMSKYTGVLRPRNFEVFQETLAAQGMADQAEDFFEVSGRMTALLYKESVEALLRTPNCGGFQLLDLHDFPGQGTALVGLLDPFWDSKGFIEPAKFREFCGPTVPLLRLPKRTYYADETLTAAAELYHYGAAPIAGLAASWDVRTADGRVAASGRFPTMDVPVGSLAPLGTVTASFSSIKAPAKAVVTVYAGEGVRNSWEVWLYPRTLPEVAPVSYTLARTADEALAALEKGGRVLLLPDVNTLDARRAEFQNHFWCPIMFRWEPMSMGGLVKDRHPAFADFPTESYTNWQWWDIMSNARILNLDATSRDFRPLLQVIDTYDRCWKQGAIVEARVGKGRLLMAAIDLDRNIAARPAARQLLYSLQRHVAGPDFRPSGTLKPSQVAAWFRKPSLMTGAKVVLADSYETGNEPELAIDGDPGSLWHTAYSSPGTFAVTNKQPESDYPHEIQIELARDATFRGFTCAPRQDGVNGRIARYEFYVSNDGKEWGAPVATGSFGRDPALKTVMFEQPVTARFIRLVAVKGFEGQMWASLAELGLVP